ncbi:ABC transporter substrate-binding protein [Caldimonas brevitalea]|uniref:ABC transporter substrate-binding protein n=2 Tax=Caldimonas brevitalea TaxID=413882 RepID=A0A0G3BVS0_9BURK|nr:ABC transporter substrate-binding protein [Caldimonas brevitalea]AKJ31466.1 ABC transporter substrate-binding protein [Caldimonas brevitalea]
MKTLRSTLLALAFALACGTAAAATLRVANQGEALSMDPHSLNESLQLSFTGNIYEPLVGRDKQLQLTPLLATRWTQTSPNVWRFELRRNVKFHDGSPFTADDVVFSLQRASAEGSDLRTFTAPIRAVRKVDPHTVELETDQPFSILPSVLSNVYIMSQRWCEQHRAERPVDRRKGVENAASFRANGTGPFRLKERQPGTRTVLARNGAYWGKVDSNVDEVVFTPIANDGTRVAALLSGEIDVMEPVPLQDIDRIKANPQLKVLQGPEMRTVFLVMDQMRDELLSSNVKGKNPFKDKRVRQAVYQAIDIDTIKTQVMRNAATPTGLLVAPAVHGFAPDLNKRLPYDPDASRRLLSEAGYPSGFEVGMNCPNDRFLNDGEICQAVAANLARVGIKAQLQTESKATYFPKVLKRNGSLFMFGWTPATYDAHNPLSSLMATPNDKGQGQFNLGGYSNPKLDALVQKVQSETDDARRNQLIREAFKLHQDDIGHVPLHQQSLAWAAKKNIELVQLPDNFMFYKWVVVK